MFTGGPGRWSSVYTLCCKGKSSEREPCIGEEKRGEGKERYGDMHGNGLK